MSLGPIMLDVAGPQLAPEDRELLCHPNVGGVILFARNYAEPEQLHALTGAIHELRAPRLLVAVDQEGGLVQRFKDPFTRLPAAAQFGLRYGHDPHDACRLAETCGWVMARELRAVDVDVSFAPVLDLNRGRSSVIGERAFHGDPEVVAELGRAFMRGMHRAGMAAVGKHFPGHGSVRGDSHTTLPLDRRPLAEIRLHDLVAFERMFHYGLGAVMAAHVSYPEVDRLPASFSHVWLTDVLRGELGFQGAVFSDDLSMAGATAAGDLTTRAHTALAAGCDMVLVCNDRPGAARLVEGLARPADAVSRARLARLHGRGTSAWRALQGDDAYRTAARTITALEPEPELDLGDDRPA
jgi:beta-N-acetylhexosaminidase